MFDGDKLANRLSLLRTTYQINQRQIANITKLFTPVGKTTISQWENKLRVPAVSALQSIADLFAVSLDWLTGRIDKPYSTELILNLENDLMPLSIYIADSVSVNVFPVDTFHIAEEYLDIKKRPLYYSLVVRANIVFVLNCIKFDIIQNHLIVPNPNPASSIKFVVQYSDLNQDNMSNLNNLINNNPRCSLPLEMARLMPSENPLFDLEEKLNSINNA